MTRAASIAAFYKANYSKANKYQVGSFLMIRVGNIQAK